ncbi:siderophore-interacting protein [Agaribacterium haliotis]|uniref:siderophore-interacting protein n=1 Tax=Agaribacterium haliotis TaxID=2013869 RepID=UPI000BB57FF5|nr:siderophore-interacting protein [Agaribacterium haliotis]
MPKTKLYQVQVKSSKKITAHMQRIVFCGDALASFPANSDSAYIKLLFPLPGKQLPSAAALDAGAKCLMRTYTVRLFDPAKLELTVDFVLHGHGGGGGPASAWAARAMAGQSMSFYGPGPVKLLDQRADWFLLAGDMTALPALSCKLEQLPNNARGYAVIEILSEQDKQQLDKPVGVQLQWVIRQAGQDAAGQDNIFVEAVKALPRLPGEVSIWAACEFSAMRLLRRYFNGETFTANRKLGNSAFYISSYWKQHSSEDEHKVAKRRDAQAQLDSN